MSLQHSLRQTEWLRSGVRRRLECPAENVSPGPSRPELGTSGGSCGGLSGDNKGAGADLVLQVRRMFDCSMSQAA
jgi:hypothetical protein